jgi:hypothetical protein
MYRRLQSRLSTEETWFCHSTLAVAWFVQPAAELYEPSGLVRQFVAPLAARHTEFALSCRRSSTGQRPVVRAVGTCVIRHPHAKAVITLHLLRHVRSRVKSRSVLGSVLTERESRREVSLGVATLRPLVVSGLRDSMRVQPRSPFRDVPRAVHRRARRVLSLHVTKPAFPYVLPLNRMIKRPHRRLDRFQDLLDPGVRVSNVRRYWNIVGDSDRGST